MPTAVAAAISYVATGSTAAYASYLTAAYVAVTAVPAAHGDHQRAQALRLASTVGRRP